MGKLTPDEKLEKRWQKYAEYVDEKDKKIYGERFDAEGRWLHLNVNGFPAPAEHTKKYNGAKRKQRRNKRGIR